MSVSKIMNMVMNKNAFENKNTFEKEKEKEFNIDNILNDLEYYMFHKERFINLQYKKTTSISNEKHTNSCNNLIKNPSENLKKIDYGKTEEKENPKSIILSKNKNKNEEFFSPKQKDALFWCFYVIKNGETAYELLNNDKITMVVEKKIKIDYVTVLRNEKAIFKKQSIKFPSLTHIENSLVNEQIIDLGTFLSLCHLEKKNLLYVDKKIYFELNEHEGEPVHIIQRIDDKFTSNKYIYQGVQTNLLEKYRTTLFKVDNIEKPIKSVSCYKVSELVEICEKLGLEITYQDEKTTKIKNKSKQDLYEQIVQSIIIHPSGKKV